jgi:hypothetical protein
MNDHPQIARRSADSCYHENVCIHSFELEMQKTTVDRTHHCQQIQLNG